ncbi:hypothetical protein ACH5RR_020283 [Cinchona calisaya]|uniref:CCHC-type domain-containing protein n=1 Tax=Cinchona calisaya TaxID=153742 RepID=A0ABD2ZDZ7_9GENT
MDKEKFTPTHTAIINLEPDKDITPRVVNSCLIGKIILDRPLDIYEVKCIASLQWKCKEDFTVSYVDRNTFMFSFQDKEDWSKILINVPWNIKGGLLILSPFTSGKIPEELQFSFSPFWVQVHGLPLNYLTKENGLKIAQVLGKFSFLDGKKGFDGMVLCRKFLRIRVVLDVRKPLLCGFWVSRTELSDIWIEFKYEKLGVFCYKCGRIGNNYRACKFPAGKAKFGPWLQAEPLADFLGVSSSSSSASAGGRGGATVVELEKETNPCTTLITVSKPDPRLLIHSSPSSEAEIYQEVEHKQIYQESYGDSSISLRLRNLLQRLIINSVDSLAMVANCAMICCRVGNANAYNWRLFMVMVAYLSYLVLKLIRITQRSWLLKASNRCQPPKQEHNLRALMEILILVVFFAMLKSM